MPKRMPAPRVRTYFISGHCDLTQEEFHKHYAHKIRKSNADYPDCVYLVGNRTGCDQFAQEYLRKIGVSPERVTIYYKETSSLVNLHGYATKTFLMNHHAAKAMTEASTHDIAWVRSGAEDSTTARNLLRRKTILSKRKKNT